MSTIGFKPNQRKSLLEILFIVSILMGQFAVLLLLSSDDLLDFYESPTWFCNIGAMLDGCKYLVNDISLISCFISFHAISMLVNVFFITKHDLDFSICVLEHIILNLKTYFINLRSIIDISKLVYLLKSKNLFKVPTTYFNVSHAETSSSFLPFV